MRRPAEQDRAYAVAAILSAIRPGRTALEAVRAKAPRLNGHKYPYNTSGDQRKLTITASQPAAIRNLHTVSFAWIALPIRTVMIPVLGARSGTRPDLLGEYQLRFVPTPTACKLTGLSTEKLREWTSRRALVPADVRPKSKGTPAKFSWQSILVLRIAVLLRDKFTIELQAHKASFTALHQTLSERSFLSLWGCHIILRPGGSWTFLNTDTKFLMGDGIIIALDSHLTVLRDGFALPDAGEGQLDLFSLPAVHRRTRRQPAAIDARRSA